jgi:hypothetical protein
MLEHIRSLEITIDSNLKNQLADIALAPRCRCHRHTRTSAPRSRHNAPSRLLISTNKYQTQPRKTYNNGYKHKETKNEKAERVHAHQLRHRRHLPDQSHYRPPFLLSCFGPVVVGAVSNKTSVVNDIMSTHKKDTKVWEWQRKSKTLTDVEADLVEQTRRGGAVSKKLQACTQYQ